VSEGTFTRTGRMRHSGAWMIITENGAAVAVTAILDLKLKADALDRANAVMRDTLTATRAFPGCEGVTVLVDSADPTHVAVYEQWESPEADAAYRAWRATPDGASELGTILAAAPTLTMFTILDGV
jgi:heme oxygenase (mycobilin-producing)